MALLLAASLSSSFLIIWRGPWSCRWPPTAQSFCIVPWWQRVLGQGSRTVRSLCHTSLQEGHGQPLAQQGVLKNQGNAANLQGCQPRLCSNRVCLTRSVGLCLVAVWWSGGDRGRGTGGGRYSRNQPNPTTGWHFCCLTGEAEPSAEPTVRPIRRPKIWRWYQCFHGDELIVVINT